MNFEFTLKHFAEYEFLEFVFAYMYVDVTTFD